MNRNEKLERELADRKIENDGRYNENPLLMYSTSQLKAELRRRKKEK